MTPIRPHLIKAIYSWINENDLTPFILVNALEKNVLVPQSYVQDGKIILNIASGAINNLEITSRHIQFEARFQGVVEYIYVPIKAVLAIYAKENGRGMTFEPEDFEEDETPPPKGPPPKGRHLKVVK